MTPETLAILTNPEVVAVDQDSRGVQGHRVWEGGPYEVWAKPLADGSTAVGLFNRGEDAEEIKLDFSAVGGPQSASVRDLWGRKDLGTFTANFSANVPKHGVVLIKVK